MRAFSRLKPLDQRSKFVKVRKTSMSLGSAAPAPFDIKELESLAPLPLSEKQILKRVLNGEDLRLINLNTLRQNYRSFKSCFPKAKIYSAFKALSTKGMPEILKKEEACFEVATKEEFTALKNLNCKMDRVLFSHPDRDLWELSACVRGGLTLFVSDSLEDLKRLSEKAPRAKILIRIQDPLPPVDALLDYNKRFGVSETHVMDFYKQAVSMGLKVIGLAFHIGQKAKGPGSYKAPIQAVGRLFKALKKQGASLKALDMGGGFPPLLGAKDKASLKKYATAIERFLKEAFDGEEGDPLELIIEPGRGLSAGAGLTIGRVINAKVIGRGRYVATVSTGRYSAGITGIAQKLSFYSQAHSRFYPLINKEHVLGAVYGKTSSVLDRLHPTENISLPKGLKSGDIIVCSNTGAYADQMSSSWCGKSPPTDIVFDTCR